MAKRRYSVVATALEAENAEKQMKMFLSIKEM